MLWRFRAKKQSSYLCLLASVKSDQLKRVYTHLRSRRTWRTWATLKNNTETNQTNWIQCSLYTWNRKKAAISCFAALLLYFIASGSWRAERTLQTRGTGRALSHEHIQEIITQTQCVKHAFIWPPPNYLNKLEVDFFTSATVCLSYSPSPHLQFSIWEHEY